MPTITIRVSDAEKTDLERKARAEGQNISDYVRATLVLRDNGPDYDTRLYEQERRLQRLERLANLD
jgi:hypothetical protein